MLEFGKFKGKWDTRISGLGLDLLVSEVQNTELKGPKVSANIPTVAQQTQGQVIVFAGKAANQMGDGGEIVLLEGREATVNHVATPHRFELYLEDNLVIGQRRAAQVIAAGTLAITWAASSPADAVVDVLHTMASDAGLSAAAAEPAIVVESYAEVRPRLEVAKAQLDGGDIDAEEFERTKSALLASLVAATGGASSAALAALEAAQQ
jgi:hypothetical protein